MPSQALATAGAPPKPSRLWTFGNALALLKAPNHPTETLDAFLLQSVDVILQSRPFSAESVEKPEKEFKLRGVLYKATEENVEHAFRVAQDLKVDAKEVLRIILQAKDRAPHTRAKATSLNSRLPDDRAKTEEGELLHLYSALVLRERRTVVEIAAQCFTSRGNDAEGTYVRSLGVLLLSDEYILQLIDALEKLVVLPTSTKLEKLIDGENLLHCVSVLKLLYEILLFTVVSPDIAARWFSVMDKVHFASQLELHTFKETYTLIHSLISVISIAILDPENVPAFVHTEKARQISAAVLKAQPTVKFAAYVTFSKKKILDENEGKTCSLPLDQLKQDLEQCSVFDEIRQLGTFLAFDELYSVTMASFLIACLPIVSLNDSVATCYRDVFSVAPGVISDKFFENPDGQRLLALARTKFPFSITPFLKLVSIGYAPESLTELTLYMALYDKEEFGKLYRVSDGLVSLTQMVDVYPPYEVNKKMSLLLKEDTKAQIIAAGHDDKVLVTFLYKYNGWAFLGRVLHNLSKQYTKDLGVLEDLLVLLKSSCFSPNVIALLGYMLAYTDDADIVEVLFRLLEQSLHSRQTRLAECLVQIFSRLVGVVPNRIWPYLSLCSLLPHGGKESFSSIIFGLTEMASGDYGFTLALVELVAQLVKVCFVLGDFPETAKSDVLTQLTSHLLAVFEASANCKFNSSFQKFQLSIHILTVFRLILDTVSLDTKEKPTSVYRSAAQKVYDGFLSLEDGVVRALAPIMETIEVLASEPNTFDLMDSSGRYSEAWVSTALSFSKMVIGMRNGAPSVFEKQLYTHLPDLVSIYARGNYRIETLSLLAALIRGKWDHEPLVLAHLGKERAQVLVHSLATDLDNTMDDDAIRVQIYDLLCLVAEADQQGIAVTFLGNVGTGPLLLEKLKENVRNEYPPAVTVHLLDALSTAFNLWTKSETEASFISTLLKCEEQAGEGHAGEGYGMCYEAKITAKVGEILALLMFTTRSESCRAAITQHLLQSLFIAKVPKYFKVHHYDGIFDEVQKELHAAFNSDLRQFARVPLRNRFGQNEVFHIGVMESLYGAEPQWPELKERIFNLSHQIQLFNAEVSMVKSFGALLVAFCRREPTKVSAAYFNLVPQILSIKDPLDAYSDATAKELRVSRIELAFLLAHTAPKNGPTALQILEQVVGLLDSGAYKLLLRLTYTALEPLKGQFELMVARFSVLRDVFKVLVAQAAKKIIVELQNDVYLSRTQKESVQISERLDELRLILSILRLFVEFNLSDTLQQELVACLQKEDTVRTILSLYLFSHLVLVHDEPVFAQLSLMFIQEFLSVPLFAELLLDSKLFMVIQESVISQPVRQGGVTIEYAPQLHRNWTNGILPILVALLQYAKLTKDVYTTLSAFGKQIALCIENWGKGSAEIQISSAGTWETTQILVIQQRIGDALPGLETEQKRLDLVVYIDNLLKHPKFLASRIVASTQEEAILLKSGDEAFVGSVIGEIRELQDLARIDRRRESTS